MAVKVRYGRTDSVNGKVSRTGDTMTGSLRISDPNILAGSLDTVWGSARLDLEDKNGVLLGYFQPYTQSGRDGVQFTAVRDVGGVTFTHGVMLGIDSSGNRRVYFHDADAWLDALGLTTTNPFSSISDFATAESGFSITSVSGRKCGNILQVGFAVERTGSAITSEGNHSIVTIKSGFRPVVMTSVLCNNSQFMYGSINTSGVVTIRVTGWSKNASKTVRAIYLLP